jgi:hypothetical protein
MYERVNRRGERIIVGRIGHLKLTILCTAEVSKGDRVWQAFITESVRHAPEEIKALAEGDRLEDACAPLPATALPAAPKPVATTSR